MDADKQPLAVFEQSAKDKELAEKIERNFQAGINYKSAHGLFDDWKMYDDFYNGQQWEETAPGTEDLPRPVTNIFAKIIRQKVAAITYEAPSIYYDPVEGGEGEEDTADADAAALLSEVAKFETDRLDMETMNDLACRDAATLGTGIYFLPWDNSIIGGGKSSRYHGNVVCTIIDPSDFYVGDPTKPPSEMQAQPWIGISERLPIEEIKTNSAYDKGAVASLENDTNGSQDKPYSAQEHEQTDTKYIDLRHYFWKTPVKPEPEVEPEPEPIVANPELDPAAELTPEEDEAATGQVKVEPTKPTVNLHYAVVAQGKLLRHEEYLYKHGKYPVAAFNWEPKRKSFFGKSESDDIISSQKERNRLTAVALYGAYTYAVPDVKFNIHAVKAESLAGGFGGRQIPVDLPGGSTAGVDIMSSGGGNSGGLISMAHDMDAGVNEASGITDAFSGNAPSSDLNASAIIALQEATGVGLRPTQRRFLMCQKEIGQIMLAHWKEFYQEARLIRFTGKDGQPAVQWFTGTDYADMEFDSRVQAGSISPYSKALKQKLLDNLLELGVIGPDEYLEFLPPEVFPKVNRLREKRQEKQMMAQQEKTQLISQAVRGVITESQKQGVPIAPEAVQLLMQTAQEIAAGQQEQAQ